MSEKQFKIGDRIKIPRRAADDPSHGRAYSRIIGHEGVIRDKAAGYGVGFDWLVVVELPASSKEPREWNFAERNLDPIVSEDEVNEAIASIMGAMS